MRLRVLFGVCAVLALSAVPAFAAETGSAAGRVFDLATENTGVGGVSVVATCSVQFDEDEPYARVEATTGADGSYTLSRLLAGRTYGLSFAKLGYIVEARWQAAIAAGKTRRISDIALCPIPVNHGVYRLTNEDVQFLQRFMRDPSARPEHPLTYTSLPQATYTKTPVPGQEKKFTREFTVSRETVIPQILHKHERALGEPLLVVTDAADVPALMRISRGEDSAERQQFTAADKGWNLKPALELQTVNARFIIFWTGTSSIGEAGYYALPANNYVLLVGDGGTVLAFLFEVVDTVSGDEVTRCRNILTIMRHEIAAFREQNGRLPTYEEFDGFTANGRELEHCYNPFCNSGWVRNADILTLKKGGAYTDLGEGGTPTGWLYSPSTGELWPATASGNGEAGW